MADDNVAAPPPQYHSDFDKAVKDEIFCVVRYVRVVEKTNANTRIRVENIGGDTFTMDRDLLEKEYYSASQFTSEEKKTRGEIAHLLEHAGETVFTVVFRKKPDVVDADKFLKELDEDPRAMTQAKRRKILRENILQGELRTLVGRLASATLDDFGRVEVIDLEKNEKRLVDPRTVEQLIFKNVKYTLK